MHTVLLVIHVVITLLLIGIILIQRSDGDALGMGGGGGSNLMSGRASANLLTRTTGVLATLFILTSLALTLYTNKVGQSSIMDKLQETPAPGAAPTVPLPEAGMDTAPMAPLPDAAPADSAAPKEPLPAEAPATPSVPRPE